MYIYATIGFVAFSSSYIVDDQGNYGCQTFFDCLITHFNYGLREVLFKNTYKFAPKHIGQWHCRIFSTHRCSTRITSCSWSNDIRCILLGKTPFYTSNTHCISIAHCVAATTQHHFGVKLYVQYFFNPSLESSPTLLANCVISVLPLSVKWKPNVSFAASIGTLYYFSCSK